MFPCGFCITLTNFSSFFFNKKINFARWIIEQETLLRDTEKYSIVLYSQLSKALESNKGLWLNQDESFISFETPASKPAQ